MLCYLAGITRSHPALRVTAHGSSRQQGLRSAYTGRRSRWKPVTTELAAGACRSLDDLDLESVPPVEHHKVRGDLVGHLHEAGAPTGVYQVGEGAQLVNIGKYWKIMETLVRSQA